MDTKTLVKLPTHDHLLHPSSRFGFADCGGCHVGNMIYGGYNCNDPTCLERFHKDCAEAPSEINHYLHLQHPLLLTIFKENFTCDLCQKRQVGYTSYVGYRCSICDFNIDLICGIKLPSLAVEHPMCHDHPLALLNAHYKEILCELCKDSIFGPSYACLECGVHFHMDCIQFGKEVNHPCHSKHSLKFIACKSLMDDAEKTCILCGDEDLEVMVYHCSICNFTVCLDCTKNPPPLVIHHNRTHEHPLTLCPRRLSTPCDHCGDKEDTMPYMCLQCDFVVDGCCLDLPRVININRHDHRISFTQHLGSGYLNCQVCHASINQYTGGYFCSVCPTYAVHTQCAIDGKVWDGVELEGIPEIIEDNTPFKVEGDNLIRHSGHDKHILRLHTNSSIYDQLTRCGACIHPVGFEPIYSCEECCFILHEKCANLPLKKRLVFDSVPFLLGIDGDNKVRQILDCESCGIFSVGFMYQSQRGKQVDIHCGSLSEPFVHKCHPDPLYFYQEDENTCNVCKDDINGCMLRCDACDFDLCVKCSTIPENIRYSNHEHPITLCCGEEASDKYWCDICEKELDPSKWFYTCDDCGVTIHIECILGDFSRLLPGCIIDYRGHEFEVVLNSHNTRPKCNVCRSRCKFPVFLKDCLDNDVMCSHSCFLALFI